MWRASTARFLPDATVVVMFRRSFCETWQWCSGSGRPRTRRAPGRRGRHQVLAGSGRCRRPGADSKCVGIRSGFAIWRLSSVMIPTAAGGGRDASVTVRRSELLASQRGVDLAWPGGRGCVAGQRFERGPDLFDRRGPAGGCRGAAQARQRVSRPGRRTDQRGRVVLP